MTEVDFLNDTPPETRKRGGLSAGSIVLLVGIVAVVAVFAVQLFRQNMPQPQPGSPAPDFELTTFDGEIIRLSDFTGSVVVVNFWGSWCPPCRNEAPALQDFHRAYSDEGVVLIGVNWLDIEHDALEFMAQYGMTFINGPDTGERIVNTYRVDGAPETFVIDRSGQVAAFFPGEINYETLERAVTPLLAEGADA